MCCQENTRTRVRMNSVFRFHVLFQCSLKRERTIERFCSVADLWNGYPIYSMIKYFGLSKMYCLYCTDT